MNDDEIIENKIFYQVYIIRGYVINETIDMERIIDIFLSNLFAKNKSLATNLRDWVFTERIPLEPKLQIFKLATEKYKPEFIKSNPKFHKELIFITEQRNIFAHYMLLKPEQEHLEHFKKTGKIIMQFAKFKNDATIIKYTHAQVDHLRNLLHKVANILLEFQ